jgi:hypothetical protein
VAGAFGQLGHQIVTGWQLRLREDARHDLTGGIAAAAHSAGIRSFVRSHDPVAADRLEKKNKKQQKVKHKKNFLFQKSKGLKEQEKENGHQLVREMPLHCSGVLLGHCCPRFKFIRDRGGNTERETGKESKKRKATWTQFRIFR